LANGTVITQKWLAERIGKTEGYVSQRLSCLEMAQEIQDKMRENKVPLSVARELWAVKNPEQQLEIVEALIAERKDVSYFTIDSDLGHDAFLLEYDTLNAGVAAFVDGAVPAAPPTAVARADLEEIAQMLAPGQRVLDVGSGDGNCLLRLAKTRHVTGLCLDYQFAMVADCMRKGLNAVQLDADTALSRIPDGAFDVVLLNQTIQQLHRALQTLKQSLRLAPVAVVGFPNFAYFAHRLELGLRGKLPVSEALPYEWYDTPNLHVVTVKDFRQLCAAHDLAITDIRYLANCPLGRLLIRLGLPNLGADRALARLGRGPHYRPPETAGGGPARQPATSLTLFPVFHNLRDLRGAQPVHGGEPRAQQGPAVVVELGGRVVPLRREELVRHGLRLCRDVLQGHEAVIHRVVSRTLDRDGPVLVVPDGELRRLLPHLPRLVRVDVGDNPQVGPLRVT
jgi:methionine biosynthesis protein MetW